MYGLPGILAISLLLPACSTSQPEPAVVEPAQPAAGVQNVEMIQALSTLNELKEELKQLRNSVEEMQFSQENSSRRQQDLFQDIDHRLLSLERIEKANQAQAEAQAQHLATLSPAEEILSEGQSAVNDPGTTQNTDTDQSVPDSGNLADSVVVVSAKPNTVIPNVEGDGSSSVSLNEQEAYDTAFEMLKQSRYQDAIDQFQALVNTWPTSQLADDALYWMSEANYVNREFEAALNGFRTIVMQYPDSSRLPEAMLKVGYIQYDIGAYDQAAKTFQDILARFPGNQVTVSAETRLRRIQQTIQ